MLAFLAFILIAGLGDLLLADLANMLIANHRRIKPDVALILNENDNDNEFIDNEFMDDKLVTITTLLQQRAYWGPVGELRYKKHICTIYYEHMKAKKAIPEAKPRLLTNDPMISSSANLLKTWLLTGHRYSRSLLAVTVGHANHQIRRA